MESEGVGEWGSEGVEEWRSLISDATIREASVKPPSQWAT